jgi:hypothetical protein
MTLCSACKSLTSMDRCTYTAMTGTIFCKRHIKVKIPRVWSVVNNIDPKVILIQKIWRGYHIRHLLRLAGPGVLNRTNCSNKEELFTFDEAKTVSPFDYFAFEENKQIYWFDIRSILQCLDGANELKNPYTRQDIQSDVKKRLHKLHVYRLHRKLPTFHTDGPFRQLDEIVINRFRHISHILQANDFFGISPETFMSLGPINVDFYVVSLLQGFTEWALEHAGKRESRRHKYLIYIHDLPIKFQHCTYKQYMYVLSNILLFILNDCSEPFHPCFIIMSGLHRM